MDSRLATSTCTLGLCLLAAATVARGAPSPVGPGPSLQRDFAVYLEDRLIGTHHFEVSSAQPGTTRVRSAAAFTVKIFGIPAYRYRHEAEEAWREGCLDSLSASTDDNGRRLHVEAHRDGPTLRVNGAAEPLITGCVMSYAYWDKRMLQQTQLLNPQTGVLDPVQIELVGSDLLDVRGQRVAAQRYRLSSSQLRMELWYSPQGEWLQLDSATQDGKRLRYRLQ